MGHAWSLAMEEQFYLVWPLLLLLLLAVRRRVALVVWAVLLLLPSVLRVVQWGTPDSNYALYNMPQTRFDELVLGAALAFVVARIPAARVLRVARPLFWPAAGLLVWAAFEIPVGRPEMWNPARYWGFGFLVIALLSALVIACLALDPRMLASRILGGRFVSSFGRRYTYSIYLWHYVVLFGVNMTGTGGVRRVQLEVPAVLVLSFFTYWLVERPALSRKRRYELPETTSVAPGPDVEGPAPVPSPVGTASAVRLERHAHASLGVSDRRAGRSDR
jgi:peptidoglycan/LPS O-acetylase OafA/YrhL